MYISDVLQEMILAAVSDEIAGCEESQMSHVRQANLCTSSLMSVTIEL